MGGEEMTYRSAWAGNVVLTVFQLPEATGHEPSTSVQFLCRTEHPSALLLLLPLLLL